MNRFDQRRARLNRERERAAKRDQVEPAPVPPPRIFGAGAKPWLPGASGNPAGSSRDRRLTRALLDLIDQRGPDGAVSVLSDAVTDDMLARVVLTRALKGSYPFFKLMLDLIDCESDDDAPAIVPDATVPADPATAIRMMIAADPDQPAEIDED